MSFFVDLSIFVLLPILSFVIVIALMSENIKITPVGKHFAIIIVFLALGTITLSFTRILYLNRTPLQYSGDYLLSWVLILPVVYIMLSNAAVILLDKQKRQKRKSWLRLANHVSLSVMSYLILLGAIFTLYPFNLFSLTNGDMKISLSWLRETPIAHRGLASHGAIENTLSAFEDAMQKGYAIELDVMLTSDGVPIVFHDEYASRLLHMDVEISNMNLAEIKRMLIDKQEEIPTLFEVINLVNGRTPLLIEMKHYGFEDSIRIGKLESKVAGVMRSYHGDYAIQSSNPLALKWFKDNDPYVPRCQLFADWGEKPNGLIFNLRNNVFTALSSPHAVAYEKTIIQHTGFLKDAQNNGLIVLGWVFDLHEFEEHSYKYCVDNVIFEAS